MDKRHYDLPTIYANVEQMYLRAQEELEETIVLYGEAMDIYAEMEAEYRRRKAERMRELKANGAKVTLIPDLAQGDCSEAKKEMLLAESSVKRLKILCDALEHRINGIKFIGNRKLD